MNAHWEYLKYVLRHKRFVYQAGRKLGVGHWQLLIHDWTKFLPREYFAYVNYFYSSFPEYDPNDPYKWLTRGYYGKTSIDIEQAFDYAWNRHQKSNKHHWQFWLLTRDEGETVALFMPEKYVREMLADWIGAGRALGKIDTKEWYTAHKDKIILHPESRELLESLLEEL